MSHDGASARVAGSSVVELLSLKSFVLLPAVGTLELQVSPKAIRCILQHLSITWQEGKLWTQPWALVVTSSLKLQWGQREYQS